MRPIHPTISMTQPTANQAEKVQVLDLQDR